MKFKRITACILSLCAVCAFAACNEEDSNAANGTKENSVVEKAANTLAWEGCKDISLAEMLEKGADNIKEEGISVEVAAVENGWVCDELDEKDAKEPYTYSIRMDDGETKRVYHFHMDVNDEGFLKLVETYEEKEDGKMSREGSDGVRMLEAFAEAAKISQ